MKKLLIFALLFAFIFTKANLRGEETAEEKKQDKEIIYEGYVEVPQKAVGGTGIAVVVGAPNDVMEALNPQATNNNTNSNSKSFWKKMFGWLGF